MTETYYKAVCLDGTDFYTGTVQWAPPDGHTGPWIVTHPTAKRCGNTAASYLSVATVPTDCTRMRWPCRLLEVTPSGASTVFTVDHRPNKRAGLAFQVVGEIEPLLALGPQGVHVARFIDSIAAGAAAWVAARDAAWVAAWDAAWDAARVAAWDAAWVAAWDAAGVAARDAAWDAAGDAARVAAGVAARDAAWDAAGDAAWVAAGVAAGDAAWALMVRDVFAPDHYDTLTRPWRTYVGPIHPDDADLRVAP